MNREIKFRGWHVPTKKMFSAEEMAFDQLTLLTTGAFINVNSIHTSQSVIYHKDEFIPLQFTGLTDNKGREIYEGDIVDYAMGIGKVIYKWSEFLIQKLHNGTDMESYFTFNTAFHKVEVIGDVYRNSEFLI